jgi:hypothetical protein
MRASPTAPQGGSDERASSLPRRDLCRSATADRSIPNRPCSVPKRDGQGARRDESRAPDGSVVVDLTRCPGVGAKFPLPASSGGMATTIGPARPYAHARVARADRRWSPRAPRSARRPRRHTGADRGGLSGGLPEGQPRVLRAVDRRGLRVAAQYHDHNSAGHAVSKTQELERPEVPSWRAAVRWDVRLRWKGAACPTGRSPLRRHLTLARTADRQMFPRRSSDV